MGGLTRDTSLLVSFETVWSGICDTGVVNLMNFGMESGKGGDEQLDERGHWRRLCTFQASAGIGLFHFCSVALVLRIWDFCTVTRGS